MLDRLSKLNPDWQRVTWKTAANELGLSSVWQNVQPDATWKTSSDQIIVAECYALYPSCHPAPDNIYASAYRGW